MSNFDDELLDLLTQLERAAYDKLNTSVFANKLVANLRIEDARAAIIAHARKGRETSEPWQEAARRWNDAAHTVAIYALQWATYTDNQRLIPSHFLEAIRTYHQAASDADLVTPAPSSETGKGQGE